MASGDHYICKNCEYQWRTRKDVGNPHQCPKCKVRNIALYVEEVEDFDTSEVEDLFECRKCEHNWAVEYDEEPNKCPKCNSKEINFLFTQEKNPVVVNLTSEEKEEIEREKRKSKEFDKKIKKEMEKWKGLDKNANKLRLKDEERVREKRLKARWGNEYKKMFPKKKEATIKLHQSTKQQNRNWGYIYLAIGFGFLISGMAFNENNFFYIFSVILFGLAAWRLFWLDKRLKNG